MFCIVYPRVMHNIATLMEIKVCLFLKFSNLQSWKRSKYSWIISPWIKKGILTFTLNYNLALQVHLYRTTNKYILSIRDHYSLRIDVLFARGSNLHQSSIRSTSQTCSPHGANVLDDLNSEQRNNGQVTITIPDAFRPFLCTVYNAWLSNTGIVCHRGGRQYTSVNDN